MDPYDMPAWMADSYENFINSGIHNDNPDLFGDPVLDEQLRKNAEHNRQFKSESFYYANARQSGKSSGRSYRPDWQDAHNYAYNEYVKEDPTATRIVTDLPAEYIDGGIVLKSGVTLSRVDHNIMTYAEWKQLEAWADSMSNIACDEILESKLLWIYDVPPVITSMVA